VSETTAVRDEDDFDATAVTKWLRETGVEVTDAPVVRQFAGGASNLTYLLTWEDRELVLRRPPSGTKARGAHDMRREYVVQQRLRPVFGYVPTMVAYCGDRDVSGWEFYLMERVHGRILRGGEPPDLGLGLSERQVRDLCLRVVDTLVELHGVPVADAGLLDLGKGAGYVGRQVAGWSERYRRAMTGEAPDAGAVMRWLDACQPDDVATCVIHNDFRLDNIVLSAVRGEPSVVGVLDWEMATLGDPLMDLGSSLAYWVQPDDDPAMRALQRQPTDVPGMLTRSEVLDHYCASTGLSSTGWSYYEVFGLFRLAVIAQQIYYRYARGQTHNPAYAQFGPAVGLLVDRCKLLISGA
jgi:aminoglycoside phosphotransferase (APT) family kinase protein